MRLHYFQHVWFENLRIIKDWAHQQGFKVTRTAFFDNEPLPQVDEIDWLVVMGGPMGVYQEEKYPWLAQEKRFIKQAIKENKNVIGICLGAQLIADVLGAKVIKNAHKEIGWFPVRTINTNVLSEFNFFPKECNVFHWHTDTFDIPQGAVHIVRSDACFNQAFSYNNGRVIGLQFHMEMTDAGIKHLIEQGKNELTDDEYIQQPKDMLGRIQTIEENNSCMRKLLDNIKDISRK